MIMKKVKAAGGKKSQKFDTVGRATAFGIAQMMPCVHVIRGHMVPLPKKRERKKRG